MISEVTQDCITPPQQLVLGTPVNNCPQLWKSISNAGEVPAPKAAYKCSRTMRQSCLKTGTLCKQAICEQTVNYSKH
jgi:hypothetical protein